MSAITLIPIAIYLLFTLSVGIYFKDKAGQNTKEYFLAGGKLPWWLTGVSIVATTFAADTPLAITGMIAAKGISGNWMWWAVVGAHSMVFALFAKYWNRSGVVTDSELVSLRYTGKPAEYLRMFRASLSGIFINCIILGWVIRAMVKIVSQFIDWREIAPAVYTGFAFIWPASSTFGSPSEALTIVSLISLVVVYSSLAGLRGVIYTDFIQFALAFLGTTWLAFEVWGAVGGQAGLLLKMTEIYGESHAYLDLFPSTTEGWLTQMNVGAGVYAIYLMVQGFSRSDGDGGGYIMQRLNATKDDQGARWAALTFVTLHYLVRAWPWIVVGVCALVLIPVGQEETALGGAGAVVAADRELAFPVLMREFLSPFALGLLLTSFMAAFMSTIDTHINWGASYVVNDWLPHLNIELDAKNRVIASRISVVAFGCIAIMVSFQIDTIEQAWKWVAAIGAALGLPNLLRWLWWRVTAIAEILAILFGLLASIAVFSIGLAYEIGLIYIMASSLLGLLFGIQFGPKAKPEEVQEFYDKVQPKGIWPEKKELPFKEFAVWVCMICSTLLGLSIGLEILFGTGF